jgi:hypothetical protein
MQQQLLQRRPRFPRKEKYCRRIKWSVCLTDSNYRPVHVFFRVVFVTIQKNKNKIQTRNVLAANMQQAASWIKRMISAVNVQMANFSE